MLKFGSWSFSGRQIDLQPGDFDFSEFMENGEWVVVSEFFIRLRGVLEALKRLLGFQYCLTGILDLFYDTFMNEVFRILGEPIRKVLRLLPRTLSRHQVLYPTQKKDFISCFQPSSTLFLDYDSRDVGVHDVSRYERKSRITNIRFFGY